MSFAAPEGGRADFGADALGRTLSALLPGWPAARLLVAVSGGGDSAALLAAAAGLGRAQPALAVRAVHVDHGLQPAAAAFAAAAIAQAAVLGVACAWVAVRVDPEDPAGLEAAARAARYRALAAALEPGEVLLTAHHEDDQAETVLLQLLRGAGTAGAAAMPPLAPFARGLHARPCLGVSRAALGAAVRRAGLVAVEDPMNADLRFDRAYLRGVLSPLLARRWPAWRRTLARGARHFASDRAVLEEVAAADLVAVARGGGLCVAALKALPPARRRLAIRHWLGRDGQPPPSTRRLESIVAMLDAAPSRCPEVCYGAVRVYRHDGRLQAAARWPCWPEAPVTLAVGEPARVAGLGCVSLVPVAGAPGAVRLDLGPLSLARRRGGERLRCRAGGPARAVKDLLREARVPPRARDCLPFLHAGGSFVGVVTPAGVWLEHAARACDGRPAAAIVWSEVPPTLNARFIEATTPLT